ncbi:MAG: type IV pilus twitching motility protein PilT [Cellulosilyticaceae bacterium]
MKNIDDLIREARALRCSDIHITEDLGIIVRKDGHIQPLTNTEEYEKPLILIEEMLDESQRDAIRERQDLDFCYALPTGERQRVNVYYQQKKLGAAIRLIQNDIPSLQRLDMPPIIQQLAAEPRGLVLVTGPTGSGKSTTLAAMIDQINSTKPVHILTIEDPIEYVHENKRALVHQREIGDDIGGFGEALKSAMRQDPDVILLGEMRDLETISAAITAAETGHLVFATLHTTGAVNTIHRIIDAFPPHGQSQIRTQLAATLKGVISQTLLPRADGEGRCAAVEVLVSTDAVASMIRENKGHQIQSMLQTSSKDGMKCLNRSLVDLVQQGKVSLESALTVTSDKEEFFRLMV